MPPKRPRDSAAADSAADEDAAEAEASFSSGTDSEDDDDVVPCSDGSDDEGSSGKRQSVADRLKV